MRKIVDSMIVGLITIRALRGPVTRSITESIVAFLIALSLVPACSTQRTKAVETEKTVQYASDSDTMRSEPVVIEKHSSKTEETKSEAPSGGILSGTVDIVGKTIALPFRAVAGLFELVF